MEDFKILKDLINFNTIRDNQNIEIINYIEKYLKNLGFKTEYKTKNLVMSIGGNPKLGFLGHTDTVEYIEEFKNPFDLTQNGEFLYGLGVCDMKGGIAAMLEAVNQIDLKSLKYGIKLFFTYDEEIGFGGTYELINNKIKFPKYMIFGEPTNNEMLNGGKGLLEYDIYFKGKKAHSSNPENGVSANLNAISFLYELQEFYNKKIKIDTVTAYDIPYTTMNVGIINGGTAKNSIPAFCKCSMDFRTVKKEHTIMIQNNINELSIKYNARNEIIEEIDPYLDKIDFIEKSQTANFMTEASIIKDRCKNKIILGVGPVTAHEVNEHISVKSYKKCINQYKELINKICE